MQNAPKRLPLSSKRKWFFSFFNVFFLVCFAFFGNSENAIVFQDSSYSKSIQELDNIKSDIQKKAAIILRIAKNANDASFNTSIELVNYVRISGVSCGVFENQFDTEFPIYNPNINDEFELVDQDDNWFQIKLNDGRKAWIEETCVQQFSKSIRKSLGKLKSLNNKSDQIQIATFIIDEIRLLSEAANNSAASLRSKRKTSDADKIKINSILSQISKFRVLAESAYLQYILPETDVMNYAEIINKISILGELQLGGSDFTMVQNEFSSLSQKGLTADFLLDALYRVNNKSDLNILLSRNNDIIQTPFNNTILEANYQSELDRLKYFAGVSFNKYNDKFNVFNTYNRIGLNMGAFHGLGKNTNVRYTYDLNANKYSDFADINFTNHNISLISKTIFNSLKSFEIRLRTNFQSGQEERRNFILFYPELKYNIRNQHGSNQYFFNYQKYSFANLGLRDTDRIMLGIRNNRQLVNRNSIRYLGLSAKLFQNKTDFNYFQIDSRLSTNWTKSKAVFSNLGLRINYYPNQTNLNFSDIQFSFGNNNTLFYNFSTFNRFYYSSDPLTTVSDINLILGISYKRFRIGPSLSVHSLMNFDNFEFQKDGNFYRFGAYAEGNISFPYQINLSLSGAYDYGFVYSQQFSQDPNTGELQFGDLNERHPTTFQLNSTVTTSFVQNTDIFFRLNTYIIDTDITAAISRSPIERTTRFTSRIGARYRFN